MSYIAPNTDLCILQDIPLDTTYEHSIYFDNPTAQYNYFYSKRKYVMSTLTYQRANRGYIRVEKNAEELYNCNYIMFRNTAFGTKWFYAFITNVEYISNEVSQINYVLDVMQSWLFDFNFNSCFIERTHTPTDEIGEHFEPEPVAVGEYVLNNYDMLGDSLYMLGVVVGVIELDNNSVPKGNWYQGVYSGSKLYFFDADTTQQTIAEQVNDFLANFIATPDNVVNMYMCPVAFITPNAQHEVPTSQFSYKKEHQLNNLTVNDTLDGYKPRNKKLYTYPYNFLHIDNGGNGELSLRYEFFENGTPRVEINGSFLQPVQALLTPKNYKGVSGEFFLNNAKTYQPESLVLTDYPICSWNFDSYKQWSQSKVTEMAIRTTGKFFTNSVSAAGGFMQHWAGSGKGLEEAGAGAIVAGVGANLNTTINFVTDYLADSYKASLNADICKGSTSNGAINCSRWRQTYYEGRCSVNKQSAEMIDTFFDKYGYAINKIDTPSLNVRSKWTYLKTRDCTIEGSVPCVDMKLICAIFDKGITFWTNGDEVGRYDYADQNIAPLG